MKQYTQSQLEAGEKIMKPTMSKQELDDYNALTENEQKEYVGGFLDNIAEWKKSYLQLGGAQMPGGMPGQLSQELPDDGLRHWKPNQQTHEQRELQSESKRQYIEDQSQKAQDAALQAKDAALQQLQQLQSGNQQGNAQLQANNAQDIANAAQDAASAALDAANAAAEAAMNSNNPDIQKAANDALDAADQAQAAADKAQAAADKAQAAADNGDDKAANQAANQAAKAAEKAAEKANQAAKAVQAAADANQNGQQGDDKDGKSNGGEDNDANPSNGQSGTGHSERIRKEGGQRDTSDFPTGPTPELEDAKKASSFSGKVSRDFTFGPNDVLSEDDYDYAKDVAERAGQPVDSEDYASPEQTANAKYKAARKELRKWQEHNNPGYGNSPIVLSDTLDALFAQSIDWKEHLREFMTAKKLENVEDIWAKRYMGLDPNHAKHAGRYLHPYEERSEKRSGIAEVFFLVDASGSMGFRCGDGRDVFEHIMSEFIQLEIEEDINRSAYAPFNTGPIEEDDIITWTSKDAPGEDEIREFLPLPEAGGGTSALDGVKCINKYDNIYNPDETLLIIATDGIDNYSHIHDIMSELQMANTVFVITLSSDRGLESKKRELIGYGIEENHVITVNVEEEWG